MALFARYLVATWLAALAAGSGVVARAGHDFEEPVEFTAAEQVKRLLDIGENVTFVDLRPPEEFSKGHLPGARSIPVDALAHRWNEIPTAGRVVLYCACPPGQRDETYAYALLRQEKYRNIAFLEAGYTEWVKRGYPVEAGRP